ncbi:kunitz trypsin inhibitor 2-like [Olea europaea subsp. europaea]|uniref:Kunitz trypsin inhibitor 2-like n=1 Tax=Olea europaea subsp. europaea TaxID=158383 RepID=A0A8S0PD77_OLEEU|nr:kunitz trypsin inhibitor 2-like [Olea europaea subsp. europaea]
MKMNLLLIPFLLLSILASSLFCEATKTPEPVLDNSGKPLRADSDYYILPVSSQGSGGLDLVNSDKTCPLQVVQRGDDKSGIPVQFFPVNLKKGVIRVSTDLNIMFKDKWSDKYKKCPESSIWKLDNYDPYDPLKREYFIMTGGVVGKPGPETLGSWFKIEKIEKSGGYKLVYCPSVCPHCKVVCKDVGIYVQNGHKRLALSNIPMKVTFKKA